MGRWEHFVHGADIGIRGVGASPAEAFEQVALAFCAVVTEPARVEGRRREAVRLSAPTLDFLLLDFVNALVYRLATQGLLVGRAGVSVDGTSLSAELFGEPVDRARHAPACEPKGATMTELSVLKAGDEWVAQCVVDV